MLIVYRTNTIIKDSIIYIKVIKSIDKLVIRRRYNVLKL